MPNVSMPNGDIVAFPDDMPSEQIKGMIASKFPESSKQTFLSRVGSDLSTRWAEGQQAASEYNQGKISAPEMLLASTGKVVAGSANDIAGEAMKSLTPDIVKRGLAAGAQGAADTLDQTQIGQAAGDLLMSGKDKYQNFMRSNPRAARNLESAGNIAAFIPNERAVESVISAVPTIYAGAKTNIAPTVNKFEAVSEKMPGILGDVESGSQIPAAIPQASVKTAAQNAYGDVANLGGQFNPQFANDAHRIIQGAKIKPFAGDILTSQDKAINNALSEYDTLAGKTLSLDDFRRLDSSLGDKAAQAYVSGDVNAGRIFSGAQDKVREMIDPKNVGKYASGSQEGVDALTKNAIPLWSTQAKMADIEKIIEKAQYTQNPATAIQTGLKNLMFSKRFASYPAEVQKIIRKGAAGSLSDDMLGIVGSRLNVIAGEALGGPAGAAAAYATSATARGIKNAIRTNKANKAINAMVERVRPNIENYNFTPPELLEAPPTMAEIMKMPPQQARAYLNYFKTPPKAP